MEKTVNKIRHYLRNCHIWWSALRQTWTGITCHPSIVERYRIHDHPQSVGLEENLKKELKIKSKAEVCW